MHVSILLYKYHNIARIKCIVGLTHNILAWLLVGRYRCLRQGMEPFDNHCTVLSYCEFNVQYGLWKLFVNLP